MNLRDGDDGGDGDDVGGAEEQRTDFGPSLLVPVIDIDLWSWSEICII